MSAKTQVRPGLLSLVLGLIHLALSTFGSADSGSFNFRLNFEPSTLDWTYGDTPILVTLNTMRGLFRVDESGSVIADLVQSYKKSPDEKTWNFKLRPEIKWSDGVTLTAQQIVDGIERLRSPQTGSTYSHFVSGIDKISAPSGLEVEIRLKRKIPFLPSLLSHWVTYPVRNDIIAKYKDYGTAPSHMAFLGPYKVDSWNNGEIALAVNPYNLDPPLIKNIKAIVVTEDETAFNLYQSGKLDFVTDPGISAKSHPDYRVRKTPILYFIAVTKNHPITQNVKALQALSLALNRYEISKVHSVEHRITFDICPPDFCKHRFSVNDIQAKELLQSSGIGDLAQLPPLTLYYFENSSMRDLAQWVQSQWKSKLGVQVVLESTDVKSYWAKMSKKPSPLFLNSKGASYQDPHTYFELFESTNPQNVGKWNDATYDRLIQAASQEVSSEKRDELYARATTRAVWENPALIPLYFKGGPYLIRPNIDGFKSNPLTGIDFRPLKWRTH